MQMQMATTIISTSKKSMYLPSPPLLLKYILTEAVDLHQTCINIETSQRAVPV